MKRYKIEWRYKPTQTPWTCYITSESWGQARKEFVEPTSDENVLKEPVGKLPIDGREAEILSIVEVENDKKGEKDGT
jgi:hypothetical protein